MKAIKTILKEVQEFKAASLLTPFFMILEVIFETLIPIVMGMIIDMSDGQAGAAAEVVTEAISEDSIDMQHILMYGGIMILLALGSLFAGVMGGKYGALASAGLAKNLRRDMYAHIQDFSFANIDRFSSASLVTR